MSTNNINHTYLAYSGLPGNAHMVGLLTRELLKFYTNYDRSKSQWDKYGRIMLAGKQIRFRDIENQLLSERTFNHSRLGLKEPLLDWLDIDMSISLSNYSGIAIELTEGSSRKLPISVKLDREGRAWTTLQREFQKRLIRQHKKLIEDSNIILETEYLLDLRSFICDCVSLIDITLHQLYIKAEFDPAPGWVFDKDKLERACPRFGGRLKDKLKWVNIITGTMVDFSIDEINAFDEVRRLRNHFMHWDPPNFCYTGDDLRRWLNAFSKLGILLFRIRKAVGGIATVSIIEMILTPNVVLNQHPNETATPRPGLHPGVGYASCIWPTKSNRTQNAP